MEGSLKKRYIGLKVLPIDSSSYANGPRYQKCYLTPSDGRDRSSHSWRSRSEAEKILRI